MNKKIQPRVAIVYLSYNSKAYLKEVADSVASLTYPHELIEFIVVDNDSPDNSAEVIEKEIVPRSNKDLPQVTFFPSGKNLGFAGGNNLGIDHALLEGADYVFLLNNDAKFHPEAITEAVALAESDSSIGSIQSLMVLWKTPEIINSTGGMVHFLGFGFVRDNGRTVEESVGEGAGQVRDGEEIAYASGAAVMYRSNVLKKIGLLDPYFFLYHEDLELGWRVRLAGYRNVLATKSIVYHDYEFKRSIKKFYWMERNRYLVHFGLLKIRTLLLISPLMFVMEIALIAFAIRGGWIKEKILVYRELLHPRSWKFVKKKRQEIAEIRVVSDKEIVRMFQGKIQHQETSSFLVEKIGNPFLSLKWNVLKFLIRW